MPNAFVPRTFYQQLFLFKKNKPKIFIHVYFFKQKFLHRSLLNFILEQFQNFLLKVA